MKDKVELHSIIEKLVVTRVKTCGGKALTAHGGGSRKYYAIDQK